MLEQDLVPFTAVLAASLKSLLFPLLLRQNIKIDDRDLSRVVRYYSWNELTSWRPSEALSISAAAKALAGVGGRVKSLVVPYENQSWEKVLFWSLRRAKSEIRVVGLQHAPFAEAYLSFLPSWRAIKERNVPDIFAMIGSEYVRRMEKAGVPPVCLINAGALRFTFPAASEDCQELRRRILVVCPMDAALSDELLSQTWMAVAGIPDLEVVVNFHPAMDGGVRNHLQEGVKPPSSIKVVYSSERAMVLMRDVALVLYNASGAGLEALACGRPALFVASDRGLDLDKVPSDIARRARGVGEVRIAVEAALAGQWPWGGHKQALMNIYAPPDWVKIVCVIKGSEVPQ
jgi:hypothetical protein